MLHGLVLWSLLGFDGGPATSIVGSGSVSGAEGGWVPSFNVVGAGAGAGVDAGVRALVAHNQNARVDYFGKHMRVSTMPANVSRALVDLQGPS